MHLSKKGVWDHIAPLKQIRNFFNPYGYGFTFYVNAAKQNRSKVFNCYAKGSDKHIENQLQLFNKLELKTREILDNI
jgi:hypothetical protein